MPAEGRIQLLAQPDEHDLDIEVTRGGHRTVDDRVRRVIAAHRVNGDCDHL
jgi:hypothetical protein